MLALIEQQEQRLNAQERQLREQQRQIAEQRELIERQRREIEGMNRISDSELSTVTGEGAAYAGLDYTGLAPDQPISTNSRYAAFADASPGGSAPSATAQPAPAAPQGPVGEAPSEQARPHAQVEALPEGQNALGGRGRWVVEPSLEYSHSSSNRLVFRGVEIITGVQIGLLEANDTSRDTIAGSLGVRYALTDRLELEARVPYVYRHDRITTLSQHDQSATQTFELEGSDLGDVEFSARYQLNKGAHGEPVFVIGGRIKSDSGRGPFDVGRDDQGVSTELATGSGFWGYQASLSVLYPTDPAVLFGSLSYLHNQSKNIDRVIGGVHVGEVEPGDSIGAGFGFGFALNPRFSYSLGYSHSYIMPTESELGSTRQRSTSLQVGALQLGLSFRISPRKTMAASVNVGVTEDAPDVSVGFRMPMQF
ncbi:MAG TPA: transporter [Caulobacterales bacterium]|nr:transporter [Caulobacterales bacterium]